MRDYEAFAADDCPVCGRADTLMAPECSDGHGTECPDRVCVSCSTALFVDPIMRAEREGSIVRARRDDRASRIA